MLIEIVGYIGRFHHSKNSLLFIDQTLDVFKNVLFCMKFSVLPVVD